MQASMFLSRDTHVHTMSKLINQEMLATAENNSPFEFHTSLFTCCFDYSQ